MGGGHPGPEKEETEWEGQTAIFLGRQGWVAPNTTGEPAMGGGGSACQPEPRLINQGEA